MIDPLLLKRVLEAVLMAAAQPLSLAQLGALFTEEEAVDNEQLLAALQSLAGDCESRGIELKEVASGYRYQIREDVHAWVTRLWTERQTKYSRALLETLALIAYRQPITRAEIEQIRGVAVSSSIIKTLEEREWVRVVGYRDVPGRPALFGTSRMFLDYFSLRSLDELPPLAEIRDLDEYDPQLDLAPVIPPSLELPPEDLEAAEAEAAAADGNDTDGDDADGDPAAVQDEVRMPESLDGGEATADADDGLAQSVQAPVPAEEDTADQDSGAEQVIDPSAVAAPVPATQESAVIPAGRGEADPGPAADDWPEADDTVLHIEDSGEVDFADHPDSDAADDFSPDDTEVDPADTTTSDDVPEHNA